jgi:putative FmdB family regulatory protein
MPTYSYACEACGKSFEIEQRISEDPIKKCVLCGKAKARRQIVSGNFILKGGGWYSDGYGSSKTGSSKSTSGSASKESTSSKDAAPSKDSAPTKDAKPAKDTKPAPSSSSD